MLICIEIIGYLIIIITRPPNRFTMCVGLSYLYVIVEGLYSKTTALRKFLSTLVSSILFYHLN